MRPHVAQHARPVVIPAQAGIQEVVAHNVLLDSRLRGNDGEAQSRLRGNDGEAHSRLRGNDGDAP